MLAGPDVSYAQGAIAWPRVRLRGGHELAFAIAKASEGDSLVDVQFARNWHGIRERGLIRGAYHFANMTMPGSPTTQSVRAAATAEARHFLAVLHAAGGVQRGDLPPILDFEHAAGITSNLTSPQFYDWVDTWVSVVQSATRRKPMIYAGGFWEQMLDDYTDVWGCPLWLAQYASQPQLPRSWKSWTLWQFTSSAHLEGIAAPVDLSYFHGSHPELQALAEATSPLPPSPATGPSPDLVRPGPGGVPAPSRDIEVPRWPGRVLRRGMHGSDVRAWQERMRERGFVRLHADGRFDASCADSCRWLQLYLRYPPTEEVDEAVWHATWAAP